ncbi:MAG TPA: DoxX family protein [Acidobacteriota bacterium]|nr:DoxX family protein [Acidobacteriota bacterium]
MESYHGKCSDICYGLMRIVVGLLFACHGAQKLFGMFGGIGGSASTLIRIAGVIEFFGGVIIALGLWAGFAAFIASGEMAVAYFKVHASGGFWPIVNHGELAVIYCFVFLYIACRGSGRLGVESLMRKQRTQPIEKG